MSTVFTILVLFRFYFDLRKARITAITFKTFFPLIIYFWF